TWDVELERSAESWAENCLWEHGPASMLPSIGQNLGAHWGRYECPAGCLDSKAKVIGSVHYEMQSSICRAAIHYGIIDNDGGWVDITRQGRKHYFIKSNRNGVQTIG
ncbi:Cysteine-rich secretory protein LCCL domain-containing 1, partial [Eschrichtius robustus]|nr:Cysteine-rich secretory protein LCCL domain-containing 1 [Eschrichtius robustus]